MDRLTQLQECMDKLTEIFFTATGVLQRDAPLISANPELPVTSWKPEQVEANWLANKDLAQTAAKDIVETAKVIDFLIDQLPGIAETEDEQIQTLQNLEEENLIAGKEMEEAIAEAERLRASIKTALRRIADDHADLHAKILTSSRCCTQSNRHCICPLEPLCPSPFDMASTQTTSIALSGPSTPSTSLAAAEMERPDTDKASTDEASTDTAKRRQQTYIQQLTEAYSADRMPANEKAALMLRLAKQHMQHMLHMQPQLLPGSAPMPSSSTTRATSDVSLESLSQQAALEQTGSHGVHDSHGTQGTHGAHWSSKESLGSVLQTTFQGLSDELSIYILEYLDASTLQLCQQVCTGWNGLIVRKDHILWRALATKRYPLSADAVMNRSASLPGSFKTWKAYYGNHSAIRNNRHDFISMDASFVMLKATWEDIRIRSVDTPCTWPQLARELEPYIRKAKPVVTNRFVKYTPVSALSSNASMHHIRGIDVDRSQMRFLMIWPVKSEHFTSMVLDGSTIYWVGNAIYESANSNCTAVIYALNLVDDNQTKVEPHLVGHGAPIDKIVGNSHGILVSSDSTSVVKVWQLATRLCTITINTQRLFQSNVASFNIHRYTLVTICENGFTHAWDVRTSQIIASFSMRPNYLYDRQGAPSEINFNFHVAVRDSFIGVGVNEGSYFLYEMAHPALALSLYPKPRSQSLSKLEKDLHPLTAYREAMHSTAQTPPRWMSIDGRPLCRSNERTASNPLFPSSMPSSSSSFGSASLSRGDVLGSTRSDQRSVICIAKLRDDDIDIHRFTYAPHTFHIGTHYVITNGAYPDELSTWSLMPLAEVPSASQSSRLLNRRGESFYMKLTSEGPISLTGGEESRFALIHNPAAILRERATEAVAGVESTAGSVGGGVGGSDQGLDLGRSLPSAVWVSAEHATPTHMCPPQVSTRTRHLYASSETISIQHSGYFVPPFRDVVNSRMDIDETMLASHVEFQGKQSLIVWDYRVERIHERRFELCVVAGRAVWICYDVLCSPGSSSSDGANPKESLEGGVDRKAD
ncbi:hypothetical protein BASA61_002381 [Batrachochytrium salamandrivorans]|nr:hypothetical protein BASA60_005421 [Batrachochytrium salamandrivorans]KAH6600060.1 hypothetical protein BASA61_002381 [Batrachochytrium salamandrivorans]